MQCSQQFKHRIFEADMQRLFIICVLMLYFSGPLHRERRRYLRTALSELISLISDSPGLLGPKVGEVMALSAGELTSFYDAMVHIQCGYRLTFSLSQFCVVMSLK